MVYTLVDHRNDAIKCSNLCSETTSRRFSTLFDVIFMVYTSVDHKTL